MTRDLSRPRARARRANFRRLWGQHATPLLFAGTLVLLGLGALLRVAFDGRASWATQAFATAVGVVAGFWTVERVAAVVAVA